MKEIEDALKLLNETDDKQTKINIITELKLKLLQIRKSNADIEKTDQYIALNQYYINSLFSIQSLRNGQALLFTSQEQLKTYITAQKEQMKNVYYKELEKIGYVVHPIVIDTTLTIENYIKELYQTYVSENFDIEKEQPVVPDFHIRRILTPVKKQK